MANFIDYFRQGQQDREVRQERQSQKKFGELIGQSLTAKDRAPIMAQAAQIDPAKTLQFNKYFQDQDAYATQQKTAQEQRDAQMMLSKIEVLETANPNVAVQMYKQAAPEDYAMFTQALGREPQREEIMQAVQVYKQQLYRKAGVDPNKNQGPASVQEWQHYNQLPPEQRQQYLEMKRSQSPFQFVDYQGGKGAFNKSTAEVTPITSREAEEAASRGSAQQTMLGKEDATRMSGFINEGLSAADSMPVINRAIELLDSVQTGGIDAAKLAATNFLGVTGADEAELSNNLGKAVLSQLRSTFGAQFTEREGARLETLEAGFGKSTQGNKRILGQVKQLVERAARRGLDAAERSGDTFAANEIRASLGMSLKPGAKPPQAQPQQAPANSGGWGQATVVQ